MKQQFTINRNLKNVYPIFQLKLLTIKTLHIISISLYIIQDMIDDEMINFYSEVPITVNGLENRCCEKRAFLSINLTLLHVFIAYYIWHFLCNLDLLWTIQFQIDVLKLRLDITCFLSFLYVRFNHITVLISGYKTTSDSWQDYPWSKQLIWKLYWMSIKISFYHLRITKHANYVKETRCKTTSIISKYKFVVWIIDY